MKLTKRISILASLFIGLAGCTKVHVEPWEEVVEKGVVIITPEGTNSMPAGTIYRFYSVSDGSFIRFISGSDGCLKCTLPVGTYRLLAKALPQKDVSLVDTDDYYEAAVQVEEDVNSSYPETMLIRQPEDIFMLSKEELVVKAKDTVRCSPQIRLLTHRIAFAFDLPSELREQLASISGILNGIHSEVFLVTGEPTLRGVQSCKNTAVAFRATEFGTRTVRGWQAAICVLGIQNPKSEEAFECVMDLKLNLKDGSTVDFSVEMNDILSGVIEEYGDIPQELYINIPIIPEKPIDPETEGVIIVNPSGRMPDASVYYFYSSAEDKVRDFPALPGGGFKGNLPYDKYSLLAVSKANGVEFEMNEFASAFVAVKNKKIGLIGECTLLEEPETVCSLSEEVTEAIEEQVSIYTPVVKTLTEDVKITIITDARLSQEVVSVEAVLNGIHSEKKLTTGKPTSASLKRSPWTAIQFATFNPEIKKEKVWKARTKVLGVHDPAFGKNYNSLLEITLKRYEDEPLVVTADLNMVLTEMIREQVRLDIPAITISRTGIAIQVQVSPWILGGTGTGEIE